MTLEKRALVVLIEDNPADAEMVAEALSEAQVDCGLEVLRNGSKALEFIAQVEKDEEALPDLILLDLNLPQVNGEEILRRIRSSKVMSSVKVMIVTSSNAAHDRQRVMELGATDYFRKPSSLEQYLTLGPKVRDLLRLA